MFPTLLPAVLVCEKQKSDATGKFGFQMFLSCSDKLEVLLPASVKLEEPESNSNLARWN